MTDGAVRVAVCRLRERYREWLKEEIAHTIASEARRIMNGRGCFIELRGVSHPGCAKTAPGKEIKSTVSVLKAFRHGNSVLRFSTSRTWRGLASPSRIGWRVKAGFQRRRRPKVV